MKRNLIKFLTLALSLLMVLGMMPTLAEEAADATETAYLMYADAAWTNQYWGEAEPAEGITATNAAITGEGDYTVGLEFATAAEGLAFAALGIQTGETTFPNYYLRINAIRVNGEAVEFSKGYTSSDDGITTRMNIYNEWVTEVPEDARSYDGHVDDANWIIVDTAAFASVTSVEVDFTYLKNGIDTAYIMFADAAWGSQWWHDGNDYGGVEATEPEITGAGDYTAKLDFTKTEAGSANGVAFAALGIQYGENTFPGYYLKINAIRINGESVDFVKGYTSSDDGITTRMNIYNEWVSAVPEEARSYDGTTEDANWIMVEKDKFPENIETIEVDFSVIPVTDEAYIMYADANWVSQYWGEEEAPEGITAQNVTIEGAGTYTAGLTFDTPAEGVAFAALGVAKGEKTFPGYFINITEIKVNGEAIELGKGYTCSDDQITTRENIMNEWVTEIPEDARRADGDLEGASAIIVDTAAFASVSSVEVTFEYIYGEPVETEEVTLTEEEAAELLNQEYHAYMGVQTASYIFRNEWNEASYGRDSEEYPGYFTHLVGWDDDNNAVDYGGTFEDAVLLGSSTYEVRLTTGDMGFGDDTSFNMLFVSTDIPSALVKEGYVTISGVELKIGDSKTIEYTEINTEGDYAKIVLLDSYNQAEAPFGYTVPGANTQITITFSINGLTK